MGFVFSILSMGCKENSYESIRITTAKTLCNGGYMAWTGHPCDHIGGYR